jgi:prefoldin, archaeal alpha subunit/eukaryotic subunit 5
MIEQESNKMQEQMQAIKSQIEELEVLRLSLERIDQMKEKEILANLGSGIFIKSEIKDKELFVNIGNGIVIKKMPEETIKIINKQIDRLDELKVLILSEIEKLNSQLRDLIEEAQKEE